MSSPALRGPNNGGYSDYVTSAEALAILAVKPQTLYSYVSRGMVRRLCVDGKASLYNRDDIRRLKSRSTARSGHGAVAAGALQWGEPVLVTGITEITELGPRYREHLALDLARQGQSFEAVAEYLWGAAKIDPNTRWGFDPSIARIAPQVAALAGAYPGIHLRQLLTEIVLLLGIEHNQSDRGQLPSAPLARALIQALCMAFGFIGPQKRFVDPSPGEGIASYILRAFGVDARRPQVRVLNAVLILLADHEFSPPTFAARIAASNGVDLHSCVGAALHVHFGSALGLRCDRIEQALLQAAREERRAVDPAPIDVLSVGFSLPLYGGEDPRAREILELALTLKRSAAASRQVLETLHRIDAHQGAATLDAALVVLCRALGMTGPVAGGLLAVSRSAGWIAHVIEQYEQDFMIRPRGKFSTKSDAADENAA
jgi:citrate synthase